MTTAFTNSHRNTPLGKNLQNNTQNLLKTEPMFADARDRSTWSRYQDERIDGVDYVTQ